MHLIEKSWFIGNTRVAKTNLRPEDTLSLSRFSTKPRYIIDTKIAKKEPKKPGPSPEFFPH